MGFKWIQASWKSTEKQCDSSIYEVFLLAPLLDMVASHRTTKAKRTGWGLLRVPQTSKHLHRLLLCSGDPKCSEHLLFFKDHVPWEDTVHRPQVSMSSEPHAPCSGDIKVHHLHCGCFLAVTVGPDTWECLQLHVMSDETAEPQSKPQWPTPSIFQTHKAIFTSS